MHIGAAYGPSTLSVTPSATSALLDWLALGKTTQRDQQKTNNFPLCARADK